MFGGLSEGSILANEAVTGLLVSNPKGYNNKINLFNLGTAADSVPKGLHQYRGVGNVNDAVYFGASKELGFGGVVTSKGYRDSVKAGKDYSFTETNFRVTTKPGETNANHSWLYYFSDPTTRNAFGLTPTGPKIYEKPPWLKK